MGCCERQDDHELVPEGLEPCCYIIGPRCMCLPYNHGLIIASQILSIIATVLLLIPTLIFFGYGWTFFLISMAGTALLQIYWCCRQNSGVMYISVLVAGVFSLVLLGSEIYYMVDIHYYSIVALVSGALWAAAACCLFCFIKSGGHAMWEKKYINQAVANNTPTLLELGTPPAPIPSSAEGGPTIATAVPVPNV